MAIKAISFLLEPTELPNTCTTYCVQWRKYPTLIPGTSTPRATTRSLFRDWPGDGNQCPFQITRRTTAKSGKVVAPTSGQSVMAGGPAASPLGDRHSGSGSPSFRSVSGELVWRRRGGHSGPSWWWPPILYQMLNTWPQASPAPVPAPKSLLPVLTPPSPQAGHLKWTRLYGDAEAPSARPQAPTGKHR